MRFINHAGLETAHLTVNPGENASPFLCLWIVGPMGVVICLDTDPGTTGDLRNLADDLERTWRDHEARTYADNAKPDPYVPQECADDARFLGQTPDLF